MVAVAASLSGTATFAPGLSAQPHANPFVAERSAATTAPQSTREATPANTSAGATPAASPLGVPARAIDPRTARIPEFIDIPAIGTTSSLVQLGLNLDGTMEVPADFGQAGWFAGGVAPGETGPAVIAGHLDSYRGPAVFAKLDQLKPDDRIRIARADGVKIEFVVTRIDRYPKDYFPTDQVFGATDTPELRLITCGGLFDTRSHSYKDNTVVFARLVSTV